MDSARRWIRAHQIGSFFLLSFTISWGLWGLYRALNIPYVGLLGMYGFQAPAAAGIILVRIIAPGQSSSPLWKNVLVFSLAWCAAGLAYISAPESGAPNASRLVYAGLVALPPAWIIASAFGGSNGSRQLLASLVHPPGRPLWYLAAILIFPGLLGLALGLSRLLALAGSEPLMLVPESGPELFRLIAQAAISRFFFANVVGEEPGWRGFVLPRLQARLNPVYASAVTGFFWAVWHVAAPTHTPLLRLENFLVFLVEAMLLSMVITWFYNRTGGSILIAGLSHLAFNLSRAFLPETGFFMPLVLVFCLTIAVAGRMWEQLPAGHPAVYSRPPES